MIDATCWQADETDSFPQLGLTMQLQQSNVVVQGLAVVVVVDVRGGDTQRLCTWTSVLTRKIVVADSYVDCVSRSDDADGEDKGEGVNNRVH